MSFAVLFLCAFSIGGLIALQPVVNATIANQMGSVLIAALCSMGNSIAIIIAAWLSLGKGTGNWSAIPSLPCWVIIGGIVCGGLLIVPLWRAEVFRLSHRRPIVLCRNDRSFRTVRDCRSADIIKPWSGHCSSTSRRLHEA